MPINQQSFLRNNVVYLQELTSRIKTILKIFLQACLYNKNIYRNVNFSKGKYRFFHENALKGHLWRNLGRLAKGLGVEGGIPQQEGSLLRFKCPFAGLTGI